MITRSKEGGQTQKVAQPSQNPHSIWFPGLLFLPLSRQAPSYCPNLGRRPSLLRFPQLLRLPPAEKGSLRDSSSLWGRWDTDSSLSWVPSVRAGQSLPESAQFQSF